MSQSKLKTSNLVSFTAVIWVVTQCFRPTNGEALRDDPSNGYEGDDKYL